MWAARTGPEEAASNLAKWAELVGVRRVPAWLRDRSIDRLVYRSAGVAMIAFVAIGIVGVVYNILVRDVPKAQDEPKPEERTIVDVTPEYLMELYKDKLTFQADKLVLPYIGKWLKVSGEVRNISSPTAGVMTMAFVSSDNTSTTFMDYDKPWFDILSTVRRGQKISALCQVLRARRFEVDLYHCELQPQPNETPPRPQAH
jgi:hypothetical protein